MDYDLYLHHACRAQPELTDLLTLIPALRTPALEEKLRAYPPPSAGQLQRHPPRPGFLGLNLEEELARELCHRLNQDPVRAQGEIILAAYREPGISQEQAQRLAEQELIRMRQQEFPTNDFEPVKFWHEEPRWWTFVAFFKRTPEERAKLGVTFGTDGPWIRVDKVDGHIWHNDKMLTLDRGNK